MTSSLARWPLLACAAATLSLCCLPVGAQLLSDLSSSTGLTAALSASLLLNGTASGGLWTWTSPIAAPQRTVDGNTTSLVWSTQSAAAPPYAVSFAPLLAGDGNVSVSTAQYFAQAVGAWQQRVLRQCDFDPSAVLASSVPSAALLLQHPASAFEGVSAFLAQWSSLGYATFSSRLQQLTSDPRCALTYTTYAVTRLRARSDATWYSDSATASAATTHTLPLHLQPEAVSPTYSCGPAVRTACNATAIASAATPPRALDPNGATLLNGVPQRNASVQCPATAHSAQTLPVQDDRVLATLTSFAASAASRALQCGSRGWWSFGDGACRCYAGWTGASCSQQLPCISNATLGVTCSGAGRCNAASAATPCSCSAGYSGTLCQVAPVLPSLLVLEQSATSSSVAGVCSSTAYSSALIAVQQSCPIRISSPLSSSQLAVFNSSAWSLLLGNTSANGTGCALRDCLRQLQTLLNCVDARYHVEGGGFAVISAPLYGLQQLMVPLLGAVRALH